VYPSLRDVPEHIDVVDRFAILAVPDIFGEAVEVGADAIGLQFASAAPRAPGSRRRGWRSADWTVLKVEARRRPARHRMHWLVFGRRDRRGRDSRASKSETTLRERKTLRPET